jgi:DNA (cytosine-5)-methyltransferase 1
MRLLDLYCGAGGAAMGYYRAGFDEIVGVDLAPQPRYPFTFIQADALEYLSQHGHEFDAIHASPPCQAYVQRNKNLLTKHPRLIEPTRDALVAVGKPYVIENVEGSPLRSPVRLCGTMFGLLVLRHRLFEGTNLPLLTPPCTHWGSVASGDFAAVYGRGGKGHRHGRGIRDPKSEKGPNWSEAMGINWMDDAMLSQAIPPAYTQFIGEALLQEEGGTR